LVHERRINWEERKCGQRILEHRERLFREVEKKSMKEFGRTWGKDILLKGGAKGG